MHKAHVNSRVHFVQLRHLALRAILSSDGI
jgi:hypothetical protein